MQLKEAKAPWDLILATVVEDPELEQHLGTKISVEQRKADLVFPELVASVSEVVENTNLKRQPSLRYRLRDRQLF